VIPVGHSWAGVVITRYVDPKVAALVYVAALSQIKVKPANQWSGTQTKSTFNAYSRCKKGLYFFDRTTSTQAFVLIFPRRQQIS